MHVVVTAGPTIEHLDEVRRLTNFSTGRLGTDLALHLSRQGHHATLLLSEQAVYRTGQTGVEVIPFTSTATLRRALTDLSKVRVDAVFHAAAVCDFAFGTIWQVDEAGERTRIQSGKISTRSGKLLAELLPTPKLITELRPLFPEACLVGWKYEVEGDRAQVLAAAAAQLRECRTNACVANGPAYGPGFGLLCSEGQHRHLGDAHSLFDALLTLVAG